jgi:hypothetical protein
MLEDPRLFSRTAKALFRSIFPIALLAVLSPIQWLLAGSLYLLSSI